MSEPSPKITGPLSRQASQGKGIVVSSLPVTGDGGGASLKPTPGETCSPELRAAYRKCDPAAPTRTVPEPPRPFPKASP